MSLAKTPATATLGTLALAPWAVCKQIGLILSAQGAKANVAVVVVACIFASDNALNYCNTNATFWGILFKDTWTMSLQYHHCHKCHSSTCPNQIAILISGKTSTSGNTKGGSITVSLTSCLTGLESAVRQLTISVFICKTD